jgi:glycosyltransferase involved in cell wall biosynthesis
LQLNTGGMEKLLVEFARHADRQKFALRFLSLTGRGSVAADLEACGWPVTALEEPGGIRPAMVLRLARLFRRWQIDVVHTHNTKPLIYAAPAARLAGVRRLIHTRHGQRLGKMMPGDEGFSLRLAFRLASCQADRLVCVSRDSTRLAVEEGIKAGRLTTIWNGIDTARFAYVGPRAGGPVVMVGRLSPEKDVATLIRAAALATQGCPGFSVEIAGDGPCLTDVKQLSRDLGLGERVRFLGEVRDIPALLACASLFVLPSLTEGISLTLLEAMARGLPVVATRVGGNPEVVVDGETGLLVEAGNPSDLADAMVRLLRAPEECHRMGLAGRDRVERHFNVRRMVAEYEALYLGESPVPQQPLLPLQTAV